MSKDIRDFTSAQRLMDHVSTISQWVRLSGSSEEAKAYDYIEEKLQGWGISYFRKTHLAYISLPGAAALKVHAGEQHYDLECITHSMGTSTSETGIVGYVIYVGAGNKEDYIHFPGNSIALINGLATPGKTRIANLSGAIGAIYINGNELHEMIVSPVWGSPSSETKSLLPNIPVVSILQKDADKILGLLQEGLTPQICMRTEVLTEWREIPILVAEIEGNQYPEEVVLLAGHVDSWHYGAMDNASANAVQLEALRIFGERKDQLKRTLRVAFWSGHSHGRYAGSTWYVDENWEELSERLVLQMYVDSLGGKGATVLSQAWVMSETKAVANEALALETGEEFEGSRFARGGDQSFYGIGVSGLFMCLSEQPPITDPNYIGSSSLLGGNGKTGGLGSWWHAVDDTIDKLDPDFLCRDARIYLYALSRYLEQEKLALDFRPTVVEFRDHLNRWQEIAGGRVDLTRLIQYCEQLQTAVHQLYDNEKISTTDFNRKVVHLERILIPLNYSTGNRFEHDLALNYPPIPALAPIYDLIETTEGSNQEQHVHVLLKRRLNYVCHVLHEATLSIGGEL